jgi:hypothetical protein
MGFHASLEKGDLMNNARLANLRFFSLLFLLPGLAGLIVSALVSSHYLESMPRLPIPQEMRMIPRNIHGTVVYQTKAEDQKLTLMEDSSVGIFLIGFSLGCVYLRKWGIEQAIGAESDDDYANESA